MSPWTKSLQYIHTVLVRAIAKVCALQSLIKIELKKYILVVIICRQVPLQSVYNFMSFPHFRRTQKHAKKTYPIREITPWLFNNQLAFTYFAKCIWNAYEKCWLLRKVNYYQFGFLTFKCFFCSIFVILVFVRMHKNGHLKSTKYHKQLDNVRYFAVVFVYCCPDCPSCLSYVIQMGGTTLNKIQPKYICVARLKWVHSVCLVCVRIFCVMNNIILVSSIFYHVKWTLTWSPLMV